MTIYVGSDHAGYDLKLQVLEHLHAAGIATFDCGPADGTTSVDYPDFAEGVAKEVVSKGQQAILICGTGIGMSMAANKVPGIRAALAHDEYTAQMSREHNNANILVLGARVLEGDSALKMVDAWLHGEFEERHQRRLDKLANLEVSH